MSVLTHGQGHLLVGCLNGLLNHTVPVVAQALYYLSLLAVWARLVCLLCLLLFVCAYRLCLLILSFAGQLLLLVGLAHVYGPLLALHQWVLTTDDQPGLAGTHGAGQMLRLTRVCHQRV